MSYTKCILCALCRKALYFLLRFGHDSHLDSIYFEEVVMQKKLKEYFPLIWEREELQMRIYGQKELQAVFGGWSKEQQKEFLDFCTGAVGVKMLYDSFFKEILSPEYAPERLEEFLSLLLEKKVHIVQVLPNDSTRIADETSLLGTDIVVELEDGSLANVEIQKIGYLFPGERCACYSSDMLLRQYKRVRSRKKKAFSYKDIKDVYTIILFEKSPKEFHAFPETYFHSFSQHSDTGLQLNLLQKYLFVPLDIFRKNQHNKSVTNKLDAWFAFLALDDPEDIIHLIETYPEFRQMYQEAYEICRNLEGIMAFFSKELRELDRNTVQLMIDELQEEAEQLKEEAEQLKGEKEQLKSKTEQLKGEKEQKERELQAAFLRIAELEEKLREK